MIAEVPTHESKSSALDSTFDVRSSGIPLGICQTLQSVESVYNLMFRCVLSQECPLQTRIRQDLSSVRRVHGLHLLGCRSWLG